MSGIRLETELAWRDALPPGLYVESGVRHTVGKAPELDTGVPAIVGFGQVNDLGLGDRAGSPGVPVERWDERLWQGAIAPASGSMLPDAVRGFFANGGRRCVVFAVAPPRAGGEADAMVRLLERGGPLDDRADIDLVCLPDAAATLPPGPGLREVHAAALRHCEAMGDRFALLDAPPPGVGETSGDSAGRWLDMARDLRSACGAFYAPWIAPASARQADERSRTGSPGWRCTGPDPAPAGLGRAGRLVPPSGAVAGVIARVDRRVGAQRAPANERLEDVFDTAVHLGPSERGRLNEAGVNCIRGVPGRGVRIEGARTLSGQAAYAHVSSVRVVLGFRRWVAVRMRDLVFEPYTTRLWDVIASRLVAHCLEMQRAGALAGKRPGDAFFVKCDEETNPPERRDEGRVTAIVGLAPSTPAEFVLVHVVRDASGFTVGGLS